MLNHSSVPVSPIQKLFWKKYPFKVQVKVIPTNKQQKIASYAKARAIRDYLHAVMVVESESRIKIKISGDHQKIGLFFTECDKAQAFIDQLDTNIMIIDEIVSPVDESHLNALSDDITMITRATYFYNQYPYKVQFDPLTYKEEQEVKEWAKEMFGKGRERHFIPNTYYNTILYLMTEDDAMLAKLSLSNVTNIERVVLLTDVVAKTENSNETDSATNS